MRVKRGIQISLVQDRQGLLLVLLYKGKKFHEKTFVLKRNPNYNPNAPNRTPKAKYPGLFATIPDTKPIHPEDM
jgi:hypothetical protein